MDLMSRVRYSLRNPVEVESRSVGCSQETSGRAR